MRRDDLALHPLDITISAIQEGRKEEAIAAAKQLWEEGRPLHDLYGDMAGLFCTYIAEKLGECCLWSVEY